MQAPLLPDNERERLAELRAHEVLDTAADPVLDALTKLAAETMEVPIALVSLVDENRQWFKSHHGLGATETPREVSFCGHVVANGVPLLVRDAFDDIRFADNPLTTGEPHVRFYAGMPLTTRSGVALGTLCAIDHLPHSPTPKQLEMLSLLAKTAVARLESNREISLLRRIVDGVPGLMAYWDAQQRCCFANAAYEQWFGVRGSDVVGKTLQELLGDLYPLNLAYIEAALRGEPQVFERDIPRPGGGPARSSQVHYLPHVSGGSVHGFVVMVIDITGRKVLESTLTAGLREREVLLQEIHHRVKNNLQIICSLMNMQLRRASDAAFKDAMGECQRRVQAIALVHEQLYQSPDYSRVSFSTYVRTLAGNIFSALGISAARVELVVDIADVALAVDRAIPCGLVLNELVTNALKHAFPAGRAGTLRVTLRPVESGRQLELVVADDGVGIPQGFDLASSASLGVQLITTLAEQLAGQVTVTRSNGSVFRVTFDATQDPLRGA